MYWLPAGGGVGFLLPAAVCVCCIRGVLGAVVVFVAAGRGGKREGKNKIKHQYQPKILYIPFKCGIYNIAKTLQKKGN